MFDIKVKLKDETDWSALGYYISRTLGKNYWDVPVINGIDPLEITNDDLVVFCSSVPSYGAVVHSLLVGVSPEATDNGAGLRRDASPRRPSLSDPRN